MDTRCTAIATTAWLWYRTTAACTALGTAETTTMTGQLTDNLAEPVFVNLLRGPGIDTHAGRNRFLGLRLQIWAQKFRKTVETVGGKPFAFFSSIESFEMLETEKKLCWKDCT